MDRKLYEASFTGNVAALNALLQEDQLILDRISLTSFNETPLHIAALRGHLDFARLLLGHKPKLVTSLDSLRRSPLHLASAEGHVGIVQELLRVQGGQNLCNSRDQDGRTPLHLAAMNEHLEVIKVLTRARPEIAREAVDHQETILHLCVTHNRFEALKLLMELWTDEDVAKLIDHDGNTLLHVAAMHKQIETMKFLLGKSSIKVGGNAVNGHGFTALDVLDHCPRDFKALETREILIEAGIKRAKDIKPLPEPLRSTNKSEIKKPGGTKTSQDMSNSQQKPKGFVSRVWNTFFKNESTNLLEKERGNLVIAAIIVTAMTFHAGLHPPGGTYFDSNNGHSAGNAVQAEVDIDEFSQFLTLNTIPLIISLSSILILISGFNLRNKLVMWLLMQGMLTTFVFIIFTYLQSIAIMSPDQWINDGTTYLCFSWVLLCALFAFISTVYFIVYAIKKLRTSIAKRRMGRTRGTTKNPVDV